MGNGPLLGKPKRLTISRSAFNGVMKNRGMIDNKCRYGTGGNKSIILHNKAEMGMGDVEREGNLLYGTK